MSHQTSDTYFMTNSAFLALAIVFATENPEHFGKFIEENRIKYELKGKYIR